MQSILEQVSPRASLQGALNLDVSRVGGEHDDAGIGEFPENGDHGIQAIHFRHLQVHEGYVGMVLAKLLDRLTPIRSFANELHIRLTTDEPGDSFSQDRMVVDRQNPNRG